MSEVEVRGGTHIGCACDNGGDSGPREDSGPDGGAGWTGTTTTPGGRRPGPVDHDPDL
ncbi:hypothetical protein [Streptomyces wuyuanensis]|uniref:hypothetical protein n=1 Tax=Streptomyces wuyuanensis TaxID=1196353 RepID=UPI003792E006